MQVLGMSGNWFAAFAILAWPIAALAFYRTRSVAEATIWTILGALLLLPSGVYMKVQLIPALDKNSIPNICALIGCALLVSRRRRPALGLVELLALMFIVGPVITSVSNGD